MLKRETLKQAIDSISARDAEIGYSLAELFGTGRIDIGAEAEQAPDGNEFFFYFDHLLVPVDKNCYFNEGLAAIEQPLLVRYGELAHKQLLASSNGAVDYVRAQCAIRKAGLMMLLHHEIQLALHLLKEQSDHRLIERTAQVEQLLERMYNPAQEEDWPHRPQDPRVLFCGSIDTDTPAFFVPFMYTTRSLIQLADLELPFFSVRFILTCLRNGTAHNLFACIVNGTIAGLVYLTEKLIYFRKIMAITFIASARKKEPGSQNLSLYRGVGTFLVAGVWLLCKNRKPDVKEIQLDSEIASMQFYESIGFEKRRPYVYVLGRPRGYLMNALAVMTDRSAEIRPAVLRELIRLIRYQARCAARSHPDEQKRRQALHFLGLCLLSRSRPELASAAALALLKYEADIPEVDSLLHTGVEHGRLRLVDATSAAAPVLIFRHIEMQSHLQGIFHLENANRIKEIDILLQEPQFSGKWNELNARKAEEEELAWVHTTDHIVRIKSTAGKRLTSIDLDTQTTPFSYEAARTAVGGVFGLLDAVWAAHKGRALAAVRPPGHHAEPNRAMGFCLFNNTALGACYLLHARSVQRVMIVDIDAHHGNGTQAAFYDRDDVLFVSMHQFPCYPGSGNFGEVGHGRGEGYSVNVPLDKGMGDSEFVQVIQGLVDPLACAYEPNMILVSCGFDLYQYDRLAGLNGTPAGYAMLTRLLCHIADKVCGGRIAFILEGGYSVEGIRECGRQVIQELCNTPFQVRTRLEKIISRAPSYFPALQKTIAIHRKYWPILRR
jgi:acetoin utilization deacetylase AcuC-like enzyme